MIDKALDFLTTEIDNYLTLQFGPPSTAWAVLTNVATEKGDWAIPNDTIGVSLINIEEERVFKEQQTAFRDESGQIQHYNPELKLNLYVLISARFISNDTGSSEIGMKYIEGLRRLSLVISFLQGKNVFTTDNSPTLDPNIKKLVVELYSYSFEQQYNFWTVIGAKYLPSALYRVRMLTYQDKRSLDQQAPVTVTDTTFSAT
jgi:hypothetical protein